MTDKDVRHVSFLRRWWHAHLLAGVLVGVLAAGLFGGAASYRIVHGVRLDKHGQQALAKVAVSPELGRGAIVTETPPTAAIDRLNKQAAIQARVKYPTLAAPEPVVRDCWVRNFSSRNGAAPLLFVVHDTESPNVPGRGQAGLQDVYAICSWFNNPDAQASSNYTTDADGNTLHLVPDTAKAWTQAGFNSVAVSDELIGYASQRSWPFAQLYAVAQIAAHVMAADHIPIQAGAVNGDTCRVVRPGIVMHLNLGQCGGSHHDAGTNFPMARFIALVKGFTHPVPKPKAAPVLVSENGVGQRHLNLPGRR